MMRSLEQEMGRKIAQDLCRKSIGFNIDRRLFTERKRSFIDEMVGSDKVGELCEACGKQYMRYEWNAGRQHTDPKKWLDPTTNWIIEDHEWKDADRCLLPAIVDIDRQEPLGLRPESVVEEILSSYDCSLLSELRGWRLPEISVNRVGGHVLSLGYQLSDDQLAAIIRRTTICLLNHATSKLRR